MKRRQHRFALCTVGLVALGGCSTTTTAISPDQLPVLAESIARYPDGWHDTIAADGTGITVKAQIMSVVVTSPGTEGSRQDTFAVPLRATIDHGLLRITDPSHQGVYEIREVEAVTVHHAPQGPDSGTGILLITLSALPIGLGVYGFYNAAQWAGVHEPPGPGPGLVLGGASTAVALGLAIPGIVIVASQKEDPRKASREVVSVDLGPMVGCVRFVF